MASFKEEYRSELELIGWEMLEVVLAKRRRSDWNFRSQFKRRLKKHTHTHTHLIKQGELDARFLLEKGRICHQYYQSGMARYVFHEARMCTGLWTRTTKKAHYSYCWSSVKTRHKKGWPLHSRSRSQQRTSDNLILSSSSWQRDLLISIPLASSSLSRSFDSDDRRRLSSAHTKTRSGFKQMFQFKGGIRLEHPRLTLGHSISTFPFWRSFTIFPLPPALSLCIINTTEVPSTGTTLVNPDASFDFELDFGAGVTAIPSINVLNERDIFWRWFWCRKNSRSGKSFWGWIPSKSSTKHYSMARVSQSWTQWQ